LACVRHAGKWETPKLFERRMQRLLPTKIYFSPCHCMHRHNRFLVRRCVWSGSVQFMSDNPLFFPPIFHFSPWKSHSPCRILELSMVFWDLDVDSCYLDFFFFLFFICFQPHPLFLICDVLFFQCGSHSLD